MKTELAEFMAVFKLELDDLYEEAQEEVRDYIRRKEAHTVTEHVFCENVALLQNEELCLRRFRAILDDLDPGEFADCESMTARIHQRFVQHVEEGGCAPCTLALAERRMDRVRRLMENMATCPT